MAINRWKKQPLKLLCHKIGDGLHGTPIYKENTEYFFINGNNLKNGEIQLNENTNTVPKSEYDKNFILLDSNSLLLSINGTLGNMAFYKNEKVMLGKSSAYLNFKSPINRFYYYYFQLKDIQQYFFNVATGSTIKNLSLKSIQDFEVPVPEESEWKKITKTLSDLDIKIELNNKINAELEAMAKLIYDYWFVQFDFPDENGKPYKSSGGKMVWNEELKREIPEGWKVDSLSSQIEKDKSGDWGKEIIEGKYTEKVFCIRGADLNGLNGKGEVKAPARFILEKNSHKVLEPYDLIVEISGGSPTQSTGRMAYITKDTLERFSAPIICSNFCKAVTLKNKTFLFNFAFEWNKAYNHGVLFGYEGKTSGIKNLLFESFVSAYFVAIPPVELAAKFHDFMQPLESKKQKNLLENKQLTELRDWLLPMLMNGQVTVSETKNEAAEDLKEQFIETNHKTYNTVDKAVLAGHIINITNNESFGRVKFQKLLYLTEHHCKLDLGSDYMQNVAGPYDGKLISEVESTLKRYKFYDIRKSQTSSYVDYTALSAAPQLENMFVQNFAEESSTIDTFLSKFKNSSWEQCEIVATLYAVWNNRILKGQEITDELLKTDFLNWDPQKVKYKGRLDKGLAWMKEQKIVPDGWGKVIVENKAKKN